jgi:hypothetical protein
MVVSSARHRVKGDGPNHRAMQLGARRVAEAGCSGRSSRGDVVVAALQPEQSEKTEEPGEAPQAGVVTVVFGLCLGLSQSSRRHRCGAVVCGGVREACSTERERASDTENCDCFSHVYFSIVEFGLQTECRQEPTGCSSNISRQMKSSPDTVPRPPAVYTRRRCHQTDKFMLGTEKGPFRKLQWAEPAGLYRLPGRQPAQLAVVYVLVASDEGSY